VAQYNCPLERTVKLILVESQARITWSWGYYRAQGEGRTGESHRYEGNRRGLDTPLDLCAVGCNRCACHPTTSSIVIAASP
jgi:hypothetical protein